MRMLRSAILFQRTRWHVYSHLGLYWDKGLRDASPRARLQQAVRVSLGEEPARLRSSHRGTLRQVYVSRDSVLGILEENHGGWL